MIRYFKNFKPVNCTICGLKVKDFYKIVATKKDLNICDGCLKNFYNEIGSFLTPKSPVSILKNDNKIKEEEF